MLRSHQGSDPKEYDTSANSDTDSDTDITTDDGVTYAVSDDRANGGINCGIDDFTSGTDGGAVDASHHTLGTDRATQLGIGCPKGSIYSIPDSITDSGSNRTAACESRSW